MERFFTMKINKCKINYELSKEIYDKCRENRIYIEPRQCYMNCFKAVTKLSDLGFYLGKCKVGYCYVDVELFSLLFRHCVIITEDNQVIDITPFTGSVFNEETLNSRTYYVFDVYDKDGYCEILEENRGFTDNRKSGHDREAFKELVINNKHTLSINESDFYNYVYPKLTIEDIAVDLTPLPEEKRI